MIMCIAVLRQYQKRPVVMVSDLTSYVEISGDVGSIPTSDKIFGLTGLDYPDSVSE